MEPSSSTGSGAAAATVAGVVLCVIGAAVLLFAWVVYGFYGFCENCDTPPRTVSSAVVAALPYWVAAVVVLAVACYVLMLGGRPRRPSCFKAVVLGIVAVATFSGALLFLVLVAVRSVEGAAGGPVILIAILVIVPAWVWATVALAQRASRRA
jgi:hypothetical protein